MTFTRKQMIHTSKNKKKEKKQTENEYIETTQFKLTFTLLQNGNVHFDYEMIWNSRTSSTFVYVSFSELNSLFSFHWIKKINKKNLFEKRSKYFEYNTNTYAYYH